MVLQAYGQHGLAPPFFERAQALASGDPRWPYYLGISLAATGDHAAAQRAFRRCLELDPSLSAARGRLAEALFAGGVIEESLKLYREAARTKPDDPSLRFGLGQAAATAGEFDEAERNLIRAVELAPRFGAAHYALAMLYRERGQDKRSREHMKLYEDHSDYTPPADDGLASAVQALRVSAAEHLKRGVEAKESGRTAEAIALHLRALEEDPAMLQARVNLLILYGALGRRADGEEQYRLALEAGRESAELHYNYGVLMYKADARAEAERAFEKALELNPNHALANHNLGQMLEEKGRFDAALERYRQALANRPGHGLSHYKVGMLWMRKRRAPEAVRAFSEAVKERSDRTPTYLFSLAAAELAAGERDAAIRHFRQAHELARRFGQTGLTARIDEALRPLGEPR